MLAGDPSLSTWNLWPRAGFDRLGAIPFNAHVAVTGAGREFHDAALDAGLLGSIAAATGGTYLPLARAGELAQLKGIGPSHAAKIVAYREKNGPFKMPEDLMQVSGVGQKTLEANRKIITVGDSKPKKK